MVCRQSEVEHRLEKGYVFLGINQMLFKEI